MIQLAFIALQFADFATTMIALHMGAVEENGLVSHFMTIGSLQGLILSKLLVLAIATGIIRARKYRVLRWANVVFSGVVLWNVVTIARLANLR
jgi:hypothetical protein